MVALVGNQFARLVLPRCGIGLRQVLLCRRQRALDRRGVPVVGGMQRRRNDDPGVEIDRMLRLVGKMGATVFQLGDLGLRIGLAGPLLVRQLLAPGLRRGRLLRARSMRTRSPALGVSMPLSLAICVSISR